MGIENLNDMEIITKIQIFAKILSFVNVTSFDHISSKCSKHMKTYSSYHSFIIHLCLY